MAEGEWKVCRNHKEHRQWWERKPLSQFEKACEEWENINSIQRGIFKLQSPVPEDLGTGQRDNKQAKETQ